MGAFVPSKIHNCSEDSTTTSHLRDRLTDNKSTQNDSTQQIVEENNGCPFLAKYNGMASVIVPAHGHQQVIVTKKQKLTEKEIAEHPLLPKRDGQDEAEFGGKITWRHGTKGDYTGANAKYLNERIAHWDSPDCLEHVVSNLIKTLEMELTKKSDAQQWV